MLMRIYGPDNRESRELETNAREALRQTGLDASIERITSLSAVFEAGFLFIPAMTIEGRTFCAGAVLSAAEIASCLAPETPFVTASPVPARRNRSAWLMMIAALPLYVLVMAAFTWFQFEKTKESMPDIPVFRSSETIAILYFRPQYASKADLGFENELCTLVQKTFPTELKSGRILLRAVDPDKESNKYWVQRIKIPGTCRPEGRTTMIQDGNKWVIFPDDDVESFGFGASRKVSLIKYIREALKQQPN